MPAKGAVIFAAVLLGFLLGSWPSGEVDRSVVNWAGSAYDTGVRDCRLPKEVQQHNKGFYQRAVLAAHADAFRRPWWNLHHARVERYKFEEAR